MALPAFRLVNTRYVAPGAYIGQLIVPRPVNLTADARLPAFIGKGSRLAVGSNLAIRRSFRFEEALTFSPIAPHTAALDFNAQNDQTVPGVQLRKLDGTVVRVDQWSFLESVPGSGNFNRVLLSTEVFDPVASYLLDYQANERTPQDTIPVQELRQVVAVGLSEDAPQFKEFEDFFVVTNVSDPEGDDGNTNVTAVLEAPQPAITNTGAGVITQSSSSGFAHAYNRFYTLQCTSATGTIVGGNRVATFLLNSRPVSGGNFAFPPRPLHTLEAAPTITVYETTHPSPPPGGVSQFDVLIELGIKLDFFFPGSGSPQNFAVGDKFTFMAFGTALVEKDARYSNTNQFAEASPVIDGDNNTGTGSLSINNTTAFTRSFNTNFILRVIGFAGGSPNRTATFVWSSFGELGPNGTFVANEAIPASLTQTLAFGVKVDISFGSAQFAVGDEFAFTARSPRMLYEGKDNRIYSLAHGAATNPAADTGFVSGQYTTDTPEGGFGLYQTTAFSDITGVLDTFDDTRTGHFLLPNNVKIAFRNMVRAGAVSGNRHQPGDIFTFTTTNEGLLDWSLQKKVEQEFETDELIKDVNGAVTGTAGEFYVILDQLPTEDSVQVTLLDNTPVSFVELPGTPFVSFPSAPAEKIKVKYLSRGIEPDPGQLYFFTGNFLRGDELYDAPQLVLDRDSGRELLGPSTTDNHLFIMNELAFNNGVFGAYYVQVKDEDQDGVFQVTDFRRALQSTEGVAAITDRCVLSFQSAWGDQLAVNDRANNPFERRESLDWFGAAIGTPIGDKQTPNSLAFFADKTLRVFGSSPSHGTRILVAPTQCSVELQLQSGDVVNVTLDGSFVAGALAARNASFEDPAVSLLRKNLAGFSTIQVYTDKENILLGGAAVVYFADLGNGVFRIEEDTTVDTSAIDFYLISAMNQKQFVTKVVRRELENSVISLIVPSAAAGVGLVSATLSGILLGLLGRGIIGQYQDDDQNNRKFDPQKDVVVFRDTEDPTLYHINYAYFLRLPIKRVFGLYTINSSDFGTGRGRGTGSGQ